MSDIITVSNLTKQFKGLTAVSNVSFAVKKGEIFGFLGPNGAGKSTTIKMLTTLLQPNAGSIMLNGFDPQKSAHEVRKSFGIVFQDQSLDDELTAEENLRFHGLLYGVPSAILQKRMAQLLQMMELSERKNDRVRHFSGGMKRRLEIARGLLHHPTILFLDEPTLGLDPQTRNHIWGYVKELNREECITVFFTTHYMDEAERVADRLAIIDRGIIIAQGTPKELMRQTKTLSLEDAFIALTGRSIRDEDASSVDKMRMHRRAWRK